MHLCQDTKIHCHPWIHGGGEGLGGSLSFTGHGDCRRGSERGWTGVWRADLPLDEGHIPELLHVPLSASPRAGEQLMEAEAWHIDSDQVIQCFVLSIHCSTGVTVPSKIKMSKLLLEVTGSTIATQLLLSEPQDYFSRAHLVPPLTVVRTECSFVFLCYSHSS